MKIEMDVMYIRATPYAAHLEGYINFTKEEEEEFKTLLKKEIDEEELTDEEYDKLDNYKEEIKENGYIVVEDWYLEDWGDYRWEDLLDC